MRSFGIIDIGTIATTVFCCMDSPQPHWANSILCSAKTDIGLRRANNQDSHAVILAGSHSSWKERGHLLIVADGMGAHAAGEVASQTATDTIAMSYSKRTKEFPPLALQDAVYDAHQRIREQSAKDDAFRDMGTTVDALLLLPQGAVIAHVGDSRVYRWRNQTIEQLTFDHSLVWEVCVAFKLPFDQPPADIPRNQITRSLGPTDKLKVDLEGPYPIEVGDVFLVCSDGLSGQINDREIGQLLGVLSPEEATETLVNIANLRGGPDNITLIVAKATETEDQHLPQSPGIPGSAWISLAVTAVMFLVMALGFFLSESHFAAWLGGTGVVFGLTAFVWCMRDSLFSSAYRYPSPDESYGNGPYTSYHCPPSMVFTEKLASILQQFRHVTQGSQWDIPWDKADLREQAALAAIRSKNYGAAIREYCLTINLLMYELKKQKPKK